MGILCFDLHSCEHANNLVTLKINLKKKNLNQYWQYKNWERVTELPVLIYSTLLDTCYLYKVPPETQSFHSGYTRMAVLSFLADTVSVSYIRKHTTSDLSTMAIYAPDWFTVYRSEDKLKLSWQYTKGYSYTRYSHWQSQKGFVPKILPHISAGWLEYKTVH